MTRREVRRTPAISSSSRQLSAPPRSALERAGLISRTPEKDGLPRTIIILQALPVSSILTFTSAGSDEGFSARHCSLAEALTAWSESIFRTAGSSSVSIDFSKKFIFSVFSNTPGY